MREVWDVNDQLEAGKQPNSLEEVKTKEDFKAFFEKNILPRSTWEIKEFIAKVAKTTPQFWVMLKELIIFQQARINLLSTYEDRSDQIQAYQVDDIIKDSMLSTLDQSKQDSSYEKKLTQENISEADWDYYFDTILWKSKWKEIKTWLHTFLSKISSGQDIDWSNPQILKDLTQALGNNIYTIIGERSGDSVIGKVNFIKAYLTKINNWKEVPLEQILSLWLKEAPDKQELSQFSTLADAAYLSPDEIQRIWWDMHQNYTDTDGKISKSVEKFLYGTLGISKDWDEIPTNILKEKIQGRYPSLYEKIKTIAENTDADTAKANTAIIKAFTKELIEARKEQTQKIWENTDVINTYQPIAVQAETPSWFAAVAFENKVTGEIIISIRWTDSLLPTNVDLWGNDLMIGLSKIFKKVRPMQLKDLRKFLNDFSSQMWDDRLKWKKISIVGHSLWGTLAEYTSTDAVTIPENMRSNIRSINFNGPWTNNGSVKQTEPSYRVSNTDFIWTTNDTIWNQISAETEWKWLWKHKIWKLHNGIENWTLYINRKLIQEALHPTTQPWGETLTS